ncbi:hypothetical protein HS088_TW13G01340 [Tripterygium wilfordii]|uniref:Uncharacterized protein n=1 Tax=Tripterygium wilfordii TaxID=458696 RepID=A0A7J7CWH5_TRIWF|nr:hypothetical protein HS088_TW13G01340 [Tripterygium wilfordii]
MTIATIWRISPFHTNNVQLPNWGKKSNLFVGFVLYKVLRQSMELMMMMFCANPFLFMSFGYLLLHSSQDLCFAVVISNQQNRLAFVVFLKFEKLHMVFD